MKKSCSALFSGLRIEVKCECVYVCVCECVLCSVVRGLGCPGLCTTIGLCKISQR
jgi:ABC-type nitrate/sulfonate/bicarbonate transport system permease component